MKYAAGAGVLPFAKRGDDRGNNLIRLQQMFPRIVAAEFQQPLHVSKDCQTLLSRMLTPDPAKRITIGEIMQHPWCVNSLSFPYTDTVTLPLTGCKIMGSYPGRPPTSSCLLVTGWARGAQRATGAVLQAALVMAKK